MKSKNIPADIKLKSIKEAQNEIKDIILNLESSEINLEESKIIGTSASIKILNIFFSNPNLHQK